jgi:hypothetical protein
MTDTTYHTRRVSATVNTPVPSEHSLRLQSTVNMALQSEQYPEFQDGDVLIMAPTGKTWKLHSFYLRNSSKVFRSIFDQNSPKHLTRKEKDDGRTIQWRFQMMIQPNTGNRFVVFKLMVSYLTIIFASNLLSVIEKMCCCPQRLKACCGTELSISCR